MGESILERRYLESSYNFGPSSMDAIRVKDVADIFKQHFTGIEFEYEKCNIQEKESELLQLDSSLALNEFGWRSQISAEEAVEMTISWETSVINLEESPLDASKKQIRNYFEKIM